MPNETTAADAFVRHNDEILAIAGELRELADEDFEHWMADDINWGHVGSMGHALKLLREARDVLRQVSDHA